MSLVAETAAPPKSGRTDRDGRWLLAVFLVLFALYAATARWTTPYFVDAYTNVLQAHAFASDGSPIVDEAEGLTAEKYRGELVWLAESSRGPASQYPPGVGLYAAPFYLLDTSLTPTEATFSHDGVTETVELQVPALWPAAVAAALSAALAMTLLAATLGPLLGRRATLVAVAVAALGTGTWSIAANMLWQHGPAMMCISAGLYLASRDRFVGSGVAFAAALLVRPHTALVAAGVGLVVGWRRRSLRPVAAMAVPGLVALVGLVVYNDWLWGAAGVSGGYGSTFSDRAVETPFWILGQRLVEGVIHPRYGMAMTSPFLVLGAVAMVARRRQAPDWAVGAAIGGLAYLLVQYQANRVSGGEGFFGYRYPLEALMAAAPMMALTLHAWLADRPRRTQAFVVLAGLSIAMHAVGAVTT